MDAYLDKKNAYRIIKGQNSIYLKPYEIMELAQKVIDDQYPRIKLNLEDYIQQQEEAYKNIALDYEIISTEEAKDFALSGEKIYYYSINHKKMIEVPENTSFYQFEELYINK